MAIPTFTSVTPSSDLPGGGQVVEIVGTNFRTQVVDYEVANIPESQTVQVLFDGVEAEWVFPESATLIRARVPHWRGDPNVPGAVDPEVSRITYPAVDIVIRNLDDAGDPIPTEEVTAVEAFTYQQPLIRPPESDGPLYQVFRKFIHVLKKSVASRVSLATHTDYADDGAYYTKVAEHPSVSLQLSIERDLEYSYFDNIREVTDNGDGTWSEWPQTRTVQMVVTVICTAQFQTEAFHMADALIDMNIMTPWLVVPADTDMPGGTENHYPMDMVQEPSMIPAVGEVDIFAFRGQFAIRGIAIMHGEPRVAPIFPRNVLILADSDLSGENATTTTL